MIEILENNTAFVSACCKVYECTLPLRFADIDADGHVNNAVYYRFMEEARMRWVHSLGLAMVPPEPVPVLAASACVFRTPLHYPGTVTVDIHLGRIGNSSVRTHYLIRSADTAVAEGYAVSVWFDPVANQTVELPAAIRSLGA